MCFPPRACPRRTATTVSTPLCTPRIPALDLAVLFISASDLPYVAIGRFRRRRNGQGVEALGYPFGRQLEVGRVAAPDLVPEISTSAGTISALRAGDAGDRRAFKSTARSTQVTAAVRVVDRDGYAVGVIRARVTGDAGIAFAIPINQAKDFLESRGLDSLMPLAAFEAGRLQSFEGKGIALRVPDGVGDTSPFRSRVESDPAAVRRCVADRSRLLTVDRQSRSSERWLGPRPLNVCRSKRAKARHCRGRAAPRYCSVVPAGQTVAASCGCNTAFWSLGQRSSWRGMSGQRSSSRTTRASSAILCSSLDGQRLIGSDAASVERLEWSAAPAATNQLNLPLPTGWVVEPGAPAPCAGLPQASALAAAYPTRDVTLALRAAVWETGSLAPQEAASACSSRRGSAATSSYSSRAEWLGVSYAIEGVFLRVGSRRIVQLEVISPDQKGDVRTRPACGMDRRRWTDLRPSR